MDPVKAIKMGVHSSPRSIQPCSPEWFMLDTAVVLGKLDNNTKATFRSDAGLNFSLYLKVTSPPACSHVYLDCPEAVTPPTEEHGFYGASSVVAADGELLLVRIVVPVKEEYGYSYPEEYFIYHANPLGPSIRHLPFAWARWPGVLGIIHGRRQFFMVVTFRKLLIVGDTSEDTDKELVEVGRFSKKDPLWRVQQIELPYDIKNGLEPFQWNTAFSFSYENKMCFVDYRTGLMFYDICEYSRELQFVKFPVPVIKVNLSDDNVEEVGAPIESYRTVGVCDGKIKFINVDSSRIKTWTLCIPDMRWVEEDSLIVSKLLVALEASHLPLCVPRFPVVDAEDPGILHFRLWGPDYHDSVWLVSIEMKAQILISWKKYSKAEQHDDYIGMFMYKPFICGVLSKDHASGAMWRKSRVRH